MRKCENCHRFYKAETCPYCKNDVQIKKVIEKPVKLQHEPIQENGTSATINRQAIMFETNLIPVGEIKEIAKIRNTQSYQKPPKKKMNRTVKIILIVIGSIFLFLIALALLVFIQLSL